MEEIDLKDLIKYVFSKILIVIFMTLLFFVIGVFYSKNSKIVYESSSSIVLTKEITTEITDELELSINKYLTNTLVEILKSKKTANKVIDNLNLNISTEQITSNIEAKHIWETDIVKVTLRSIDQENITKIVDNIVEVSVNEIKGLYEIKNVQVLEKATEPIDSSKSSSSAKTLIISIIGFILGFVVVFIMYCFSNTIKSESDIERLELSIIGEVPFNRKKRIIKRNKIQEEIKKISILLKNKYISNKENVLMITSVSKNEGKTFLANNLANAFSQLGLKVLLMDFNLNNIEQKKSLASILSNDIKNYKKHINNKKISVLKSGINNINSWDLLNSEKMKELVNLLKEEYDLIILDCPSMNESATTLSLTKYANFIVLTCLNKKTPLKLFKICKKQLQDTNLKIAGVVINK